MFPGFNRPPLIPALRNQYRRLRGICFALLLLSGCAATEHGGGASFEATAIWLLVLAAAFWVISMIPWRPPALLPMLYTGLCRLVLLLARRSISPKLWAEAQHSLALAYYFEGIAYGDSDRFVAAARAWQATLEVYTPTAAPEKWARSQTHLGLTLLALGNARTDEESASLALVALRAAFCVRTPERPREWTFTAQGLAEALVASGQYQIDPALLLEAEQLCTRILALNAEADVYRLKLEWSGFWAWRYMPEEIQNCLGGAQRTLGMRDIAPTRLQAALRALETEEKRLSPMCPPETRAMQQCQQAIVLTFLGAREIDTTHLRAAVDRFQAALQTWPGKSRLPWFRAETEGVFAVTLALLGKRENDMARLEQAVTLSRAALAALQRDKAPETLLRMARINLGSTLALQGEQSANPAVLQEAERILAQDDAPLSPENRLAALAVQRRLELCWVRLLQGEQEAKLECLRRALDDSRAIQAVVGDFAPLWRVSAQILEGRALFALGISTQNEENVQQAQTLLRAVLTETRTDLPAYVQEIEVALRRRDAGNR